MSGPDVVLVTGAEMPVPDTESPLLVRALAKLGLRAEVWVWCEPHEWSAPALVVCRTPWDYFGRAREFLAWADTAASAARLENCASLVRWNAHKSYLVELAGAGLPVVPTTLLPQGAGEAEQAAALTGREELVVKPAIGGGALGTRRGQAADPALAAHLSGLLADGDTLVQPLITTVAQEGEVSLIYFDGALSHVVRKVPATGDFRVQPQYGGAVLAHTATREELATGESVLANVPGLPAYARIDLVSGPAGPLLMEAELIEPFLFLDTFAPATDRFAAVLAGRVR